MHARTHGDGDRTALKVSTTAATEPAGEDSEVAEPADQPVVFVGGMEHHSNLLVWRDSNATVVEVASDAYGRVQLDRLEEQLRLHQHRRVKIGSFSAASNVTGIMENVDAVTALLHKHGALAFWDYAAAAPHTRIDMNPPATDAAKDAVFFSPHKFPGGPGTPGVLVVKKRLLANAVPSGCPAALAFIFLFIYRCLFFFILVQIPGAARCST